MVESATKNKVDYATGNGNVTLFYASVFKRTKKCVLVSQLAELLSLSGQDKKAPTQTACCVDKFII